MMSLHVAHHHSCSVGMRKQRMNRKNTAIVCLIELAGYIHDVGRYSVEVEFARVCHGIRGLLADLRRGLVVDYVCARRFRRDERQK